MATSRLVPVLAPDGTPGYVPQNRLSEALAAGGKEGVGMLAPNGRRGVVPKDQAQAAIQAGGQLIGAPVSAPKMNLPEAGPASRMLTAAGASFPTPREAVRGLARGPQMVQGAQGGPEAEQYWQGIAAGQQPDAEIDMLTGRIVPQGQTAGASDLIPGFIRRLVSDDVAGGLGEGAGVIAQNAPAAVQAYRAIPTTKRAGETLQSVERQAAKVPVQLEHSQNATLRLMDWQKKTQLGPTLNKYLNRVTNPKLGPLTYDEARKYYQLLGNLSAEEKGKLAGEVGRDLKQLVRGLKQDIGTAAEEVGRGADYYAGMNQYRSAARIRDAKEAVTKTMGPAAARGAAYGAGGATAGGAVYSLYRLLFGSN